MDYEEDIREKVKEVFREVAELMSIIEEVNIASDPVDIFLSFPPRCSIAHVVGVLKSISRLKYLRSSRSEEGVVGRRVLEDGILQGRWR